MPTNDVTTDRPPASPVGRVRTRRIIQPQPGGPGGMVAIEETYPERTRRLRRAQQARAKEGPDETNVDPQKA